MNIVATPKGGTHVTGFERGLLKVFLGGLEGTRLLKSGDEITKDDVLEGLTAVVTVRLPEPQFEGQTKEVLGTPPVTRLVAQVVETELGRFLNSTKASERPQARTVMEKVVNASRTRVAARVHKENQRRKTALESSSLPPKLKDCRSNSMELSELFIVEGRLGSRHRQFGAQLRVPSAATDPWQDPQRAEGQRRRHAEERRMCRDHPGGRGGVGAHLRCR